MHHETTTKAIKLLQELSLNPTDRQTALYIIDRLKTSEAFDALIPADLPPFDPEGDGEFNNGMRADRAQRALTCHIGDDRRDPDDQDHLKDLFCNLLHLAHRDGIDIQTAFVNGALMFIEESTQPPVPSTVDESAIYARDVLKALEDKLSTDQEAESVIRISPEEAKRLRTALVKLI